MDHLGAPLALRFRLAGNGPDHLVGQIHLLDLDHRDLDAPWRRVLIEDGLQPDIQFLPLAEQLIQFGLPQHASQGRLRELRSGV